MVQQRQCGAVVLISCRAVANGPRAEEPAGAVRPTDAQASERNVLLGRADLEVCPASQRTAVALAAPDFTGDVA